MERIYLDAGAFRDFVEIFENQYRDDGYGGFEENWVSRAHIWARILPSRAQQIQQADQRRVNKTHIIDMRQPIDLKVGFRINLVGIERVFEVLTIIDPDETARYWRCECVEINP